MSKNKKDSARHSEVSDQELRETSGGGIFGDLGKIWSKASESGGMRGERIGNLFSADLTAVGAHTKHNNYNNPKDDKK